MHDNDIKYDCISLLACKCKVIGLEILFYGYNANN